MPLPTLYPTCNGYTSSSTNLGKYAFSSKLPLVTYCSKGVTISLAADVAAAAYKPLPALNSHGTLLGCLAWLGVAAIFDGLLPSSIWMPSSVETLSWTTAESSDNHSWLLARQSMRHLQQLFHWTRFNTGDCAASGNPGLIARTHAKSLSGSPTAQM